MYTDALDDACGAQLSQEQDSTKFPIAFLSHTFTETQRKWSTPEQEAYGVYYAITKWNYCLQGANIIVYKDHKPLAKFLNGMNTNNKVNRWGLELASYNIMFKLILEARNKAVNCLYRSVELLTNSKATIKFSQPLICMDQHSTQEAKHHTTAKTNSRHQTFKYSNLQGHNSTRLLWILY